MSVTRSTTPQGVPVVHCGTWDAFVSVVRGGTFPGSPAVERIFRGQSDPKWLLSSMWERALGHRHQQNGDGVVTEGPVTQRLEARLEAFKAYAHGSAGIKRL